jgi:biopolymer transport protein ExbD
LARALAAYSQPETTLVISADAMASHQAVISAMEAARQSGLSRITFATQTGEGKSP